MKFDDISEKWYDQPGTGHRWVLGYEKVFLVDGAGAVIRTIARRPDNSWLAHPESASVAANGSIAIVSSRGDGMGGGEVTLNLYSSQGDPIRTFTLPQIIDWSFPRIAYNGNRVIVVDAKTIACFDDMGKPIGQIPPSVGPDAWRTPFLDSEGRKLSLFDGEKTILNYVLP